jgi:hypothetical protein
MAALCLVMLSATRLSLGGRRLWWVGAISGVTVAVFSKESFASLGLVLPIVGAYCYTTHGKRRVDLVAGLSGVLPSVVLAVVLLPDLRDGGTDVYGRSVGEGRLSAGVRALSDSSMRPTVVSALIAAIASVIWGWIGPGRRNNAARVYVIALIVWALAAIVMDSWFYGGNHFRTHYFAFVDWATLTLLLGAACLVLSTLESRGRNVAWWLRAACGAISLTMVVWIVLIATKELGDIRQRVSLQATASIVYQDGLARVVSQLDEGDALVVVPSNELDAEPAYALLNEVARRTEGAQRQYLLVDSREAGSVVATMNDVSEEGSPAWKAQPLDEWRPGSGDVCVFINSLPRRIEGCPPTTSTTVVALGM